MFIPDPRWEEPNLLIPGKKPTGPVVIDWSHPLARGLVYGTLHSDDMLGNLGVADNCRNIVNNSRDFPFVLADNNHYLEFGVCPAGHGGISVVSGTAPYRMEIASNTGFPVGAASCTFLYGIYVGSGSTSGAIENFRIDSHCDLQVVSWTSSAYTLRHAFTGQWNTTGDTAVSIDTQSKAIVAGWTFDGGVGRMYGNGNFLHTKTGSATLGGSGSTFKLQDMAYQQAGVVFLFRYMWSRAISASEMAEISRNPYQFLIPA